MGRAHHWAVRLWDEGGRPLPGRAERGLSATAGEQAPQVVSPSGQEEDRRVSRCISNLRCVTSANTALAAEAAVESGASHGDVFAPEGGTHKVRGEAATPQG